MNLFAKLIKIGFAKINSNWTGDYGENENKALFSARRKLPTPSEIIIYLFVFHFLYYSYFDWKNP